MSEPTGFDNDMGQEDGGADDEGNDSTPNHGRKDSGDISDWEKMRGEG